MFSLESPHGGGSYDYTQYTIFNIKKKITLNYSKSAALEVFPRDSSTTGWSGGAMVLGRLPVPVRPTRLD